MKKIVKNGDTLMEVMLAISIFAMLMVGGLTLMNNGLAKAQSTLELTMARNAIDAQAESLRFLNDAFIAQYPNGGTSHANQWLEITKNENTKKFASKASECLTDFNQNNIFVVNPRTMKKVNNKPISAITYPRISYSNTQDENKIDSNWNTNVDSSQGIWIETVKGDGNYYDFHIRACWNAAGANVPSTIGTIVRLYDPRS